MQRNKLYQSIKDRNENEVRNLLKMGINPNLESSQAEMSPLWLAIDIFDTTRQPNDFKIIELLVNHGANVIAVNMKCGSTPLHFAAQIGDRALLDLLLNSDTVKKYRKEELIHLQDKKNKTPFIIAANKGHFAIVQSFLATPETPNLLATCRCDNGYEANVFKILIDGEESEQRIQVFCLLVEKQMRMFKEDAKSISEFLNELFNYCLVGLDVRLKFGNIILQLIIQNKDMLDIKKSLFNMLTVEHASKLSMPLTKQLLAIAKEKKIETLQVPDGRGGFDEASLIHFAAQSGQMTALILLIAAGVDLNVKTVRGHTPLLLALVNKKNDAVNVLLQKTKDTIADQPWSLFVLAWDANNYDSIPLILKYINIDYFSNYPTGRVRSLTAALSSDNVNYNLVKLLLENGASPYNISGDTNTPISMAIIKNDPTLLKLILRDTKKDVVMACALKSDTIISRMIRQNPFFLSLEHENPEIINTLFLHGYKSTDGELGESPMLLAIMSRKIEFMRCVRADIQRLVEKKSPDLGICLQYTYVFNVPDITRLFIDCGADCSKIKCYENETKTIQEWLDGLTVKSTVKSSDNISPAVHLERPIAPAAPSSVYSPSLFLSSMSLTPKAQKTNKLKFLMEVVGLGEEEAKNQILTSKNLKKPKSKVQLTVEKSNEAIKTFSWCKGKVSSADLKMIRGEVPNCFLWVPEQLLRTQACSEELLKNILVSEPSFNGKSIKKLTDFKITKNFTIQGVPYELTAEHEFLIHGKPERLLLFKLLCDKTVASVYIAALYCPNGLHQTSDSAKLSAIKHVYDIDLPTSNVASAPSNSVFRR